jgi:hypothetical protein
VEEDVCCNFRTFFLLGVLTVFVESSDDDSDMLERHRFDVHLNDSAVRIARRLANRVSLWIATAITNS